MGFKTIATSNGSCCNADMNRRGFLKAAGMADATVTFGGMPWTELKGAAPAPATAPTTGWVDKPMRWAQLTLVENDPGKFHSQFWPLSS